MKGTDKQDEQKQRADEQESEQNSTAQVREQQQQDHRKRHGTNERHGTNVGTRRVRQQYPATLPQPNPYPIYQGYAYPYDSEYMEHQQHQQQWGIAAVGNPYW